MNSPSRIILKAAIALVPGTIAGPLAMAGAGFTPGHVFVTVTEIEGCDFGYEEGILEIDPSTGEVQIFADSSDGICVANGLRFTPSQTELYVLNAGHLLPADLGWIQAFTDDGSSTIVLDGGDGLSRPVGANGIAYDSAGNLYVVNSLTSQIVRFPADGSPVEVFADEEDGIDDRGAIDFAPNGDLYYAGDLAEAIIRITQDGVGTFFDQPPAILSGLAFDSIGNLFVSSRGGTVYRYADADPAQRTILATELTDTGGFSTVLVVSPDDSVIYLAAPFGDAGTVSGYLYAIDSTDGTATILADFSSFSEPFVIPTGIAVVPFAPGDLNLDDAVDLLDFGILQACFTGPGGGPVGQDCLRADLDGDGDVDLYDYGLWREAQAP